MNPIPRRYCLLYKYDIPDLWIGVRRGNITHIVKIIWAKTTCQCRNLWCGFRVPQWRLFPFLIFFLLRSLIGQHNKYRFPIGLNWYFIPSTFDKIHIVDVLIMSEHGLLPSSNQLSKSEWMKQNEIHIEH